MKTILTSFAIATLTLLGVTTEAEARHPSGGRVYISGYRSCGTPVYSERYFAGYDHCGNPVWQVRTVRQSYYQPEVRRRYVAPCPPPYRGRDNYSYSAYRRPCSSGEIVIQGRFGR